VQSKTSSFDPDIYQTPIYPISKFYLLLSLGNLRGNALAINHFFARRSGFPQPVN
jgi:hypothetical protein